MDNDTEFVCFFIEMYEQHPCLWKVNDDGYKDKSLRDEAYGELLALYKEVNPMATVKSVKKKINNLRSSFLKEVKKVNMSLNDSSAPEIYMPSLWYYDMLEFLIDQKRPRKKVTPDEVLKPLSISEDEMNSLLQSRPPKAEPESTPSAQPSSRKRSSAPKPRPAKKPLNDVNASTTREQLTIDESHATENTTDEFDGIGINVSCKLRRMDEDQRMYAELLINKVLFSGIKGRLREETDITGLSFLRPSNPPILSKIEYDEEFA